MAFVVHLKNVMRLTLVRQAMSVSRVAVNLSANVGPTPIARFCSVVLKVSVRKRDAAIMTAIAGAVKFVMHSTAFVFRMLNVAVTATVHRIMSALLPSADPSTAVVAIMIALPVNSAIQV